VVLYSRSEGASRNETEGHETCHVAGEMLPYQTEMKSWCDRRRKIILECCPVGSAYDSRNRSIIVARITQRSIVDLPTNSAGYRKSRWIPGGSGASVDDAGLAP
jgi:hypothetical protein